MTKTKVTYRIETLSGRGLPTGTDADGYDTREAAEAMADAMHDGEYRIATMSAAPGPSNCGCYEECACTLHGCWAAESAVDLARAAIAKAGGA